MKRPFILSCIFCLVAGLLVGGVLPMPWDSDGPPAVNTMLRAPSSTSSDPNGLAGLSPEPLDSKDNFQLLNSACYVLQALKNSDYATVASMVHPEKGVTFTPYSTVDFTTDLTLTSNQVKDLEQDSSLYTWGRADGRGSPIQLTISQYFAQYVFNADYTQSSQIGVDQVMISGNALENVAEAYPDCRFVDFSIPGQSASSQGMDWSSLKLVFAPGETCWYLVGIVHGQWTI